MPCTSAAGRTPFFPTFAPGGGPAGGATAGVMPGQWLLWWQPAWIFETGWFFTMGVADMVMTATLLGTGLAVEINPMARFFLSAGGLHGLVGYKCTMLALVSACTQLIALQRPRTAKVLLHAGIWVQLLVVVYSVVLLMLMTLVDD
ncbi:MAG: DUF5658 family protein [Limisphaerales bacterium]